MKGQRHSIAGAGGVRIGLLTAGEGRPLLLVHGGMGCIESWTPIWRALTEHRRVTAMDRRGRGSSGDAERYEIATEYDDIVAVSAALAQDQGVAIDVFAHSYGATCTLGAAARSAPFARAVLYEPPGPQTVTSEWVDRAGALAERGQEGRAMFSFLREILGMPAAQIEELRDAPRAYDVLPIVAATLAREARALLDVDLCAGARSVPCPTALLLGERSPGWAGSITRSLAEALAECEIARLAGEGHDAIDRSPDLVVRELDRLLPR